MLLTIHAFFTRIWTWFYIPSMSVAYHKIDILYIAKHLIESEQEHFLCHAIGKAAGLSYGKMPTSIRKKAAKELLFYIASQISPYNNLDSFVFGIDYTVNSHGNLRILYRMAWVDKMRAMLAEDESACGGKNE